MVTRMDYKFIICGTSGVGKSWIIRHFFEGKTFDEIDELGLGPTKEPLNFSDRPFRLGNMAIYPVDTGGQELLRAKIHNELEELCWMGTNACIYVIDLATDIIRYETMKQKGIEYSDTFIRERLEEAKNELKEVINSILRFALPNSKIRLIILFHKWDLLKIFPEDIQDKWKEWLINEIKGIENDEKYDIFNNRTNNNKIKFLGFHTTSIMDNSCKSAIRKILPRQEQLRRVLFSFIDSCRDLEANQVYIAALNEDCLEIESIQYPYLTNTEPYLENIIRYFIPSLTLKEKFESTGITSLCLLKEPDRSIIVLPLHEGIIILLVTDITDLMKIRLIIKDLEETLHNVNNIINIYYV